jgi:hypothetical protein
MAARDFEDLLQVSFTIFSMYVMYQLTMTISSVQLLYSMGSFHHHIMKPFKIYFLRVHTGTPLPNSECIQIIL